MKKLENKQDAINLVAELRENAPQVNTTPSNWTSTYMDYRDQVLAYDKQLTELEDSLNSDSWEIFIVQRLLDLNSIYPQR